MKNTLSINQYNGTRKAMFFKHSGHSDECRHCPGGHIGHLTDNRFFSDVLVRHERKTPQGFCLKGSYGCCMSYIV